MNWLGYGWPGLAPLWKQGDWRGLACAAVFTLVLNHALLTGGWFSWLLVGVAWVVGTIITARWMRQAAPRSPSATTEERRRDLFSRAQTEYLKGHWFEAEALLEELLRDDGFDLPAHLLLATLWRHTGRFEQAKKRLQFIERLPGAAQWRLECEQERKAIARREAEQQAEAEQQEASFPGAGRLEAA